jgi:hypothetical protein
MTFVDNTLDRLGRWLARWLNTPPAMHPAFSPRDFDLLRSILKPADVVLIEGHDKVSAAIKYLTQSTWSHAALYVGDALGPGVGSGGDSCCLVEVNLGEGCVPARLSKYRHSSIRICRPYGLTDEDRAGVVQFMVSRIGLKYDLRNILDLARYLVPAPPVPARWRRRLIALGSGEPTRAICSTLIAQAFGSVKYPILPRIERVMRQDCTDCPITTAEILHIRHHSLYAPRDFDLSPYFQVVKPALESGFDYKRLEWSDAPPGQGSLRLIKHLEG